MTKHPVNSDRRVQIDAIRYNEPTGFVTCNLYTPGRCVKIFLPLAEYEELAHDGFFIRDGQTRDSANVLNTTLSYAELVKTKSLEFQP